MPRLESGFGVVLGRAVVGRAVVGKQARAGAPGKEKQQRFSLQAPECEAERRGRGGIEPLVVVDRDDHRSTGSERSEDRLDGDAERPWVERPSAIRAQQRRVERATARSRELLQDLRRDLPEQVAEHEVREAALGFGRAGAQDVEESLVSGRRRRQPEGGLPDAGLTLENQRPDPARRSIQERVDLHERGIAADDLAVHRADHRPRPAPPQMRCTLVRERDPISRLFSDRSSLVQGGHPDRRIDEESLPCRSSCWPSIHPASPESR